MLGINFVLDVRSVQFADGESRFRQMIYCALAGLLSIGFLFAVLCYWVPAHPGTDQNGYLVGGKMFSKTLTMALAPTRPGTDEFDPHQFVGRMWVGAGLGTPAERYYPKYPLGLPLLYAIALWISALFKPEVSLWLTYGINPIAMALAVFATYLLTRKFAGSFYGFLGAVAFASSPVTVGLATVPSSHATAVCCVSWGMYFLLSYWELGGVLRALAAGFLLGYAGTIRYSEGTLILPIMLVAWFTLSRKRLATTVALSMAWLLPIALLVLYNRSAIGTNTGYDPTHESSGFGLSFAADNWETMFRQLDTNGLSLLLPLSLAGLVWMFWWNWRIASVLSAWVCPCMIVYMFYYWAPDNTSISYLRFFTTILPALALTFFWFVTRLQRVANLHMTKPVRRRFAIPLTVVAVLGSLVICWMTSLHLWLGEYASASVGMNENWQLIHRLTPLDADVDTGMIHAAGVAFLATFGWAIVGACAVGVVVLGLFRGRVELPSIGASLLTGLVAGMHLTNALPAIEIDQLNRFGVQTYVQVVRDAVPAGSVIVGLRTDREDQPLFNDLQFAGDYDLVAGETFLASYVQGLPASDPDSPQTLDPGRRDALFNRLKKFDQNALDEQARRAVLDAIAKHRRIFVVVPRRDPEAQLRRERAKPAPTNRKPIPLTAGQTLRRNLIKQMPDLVQRLCAGDRLQFDVASSWVAYVPRVITPTVGPRGLRLPRQEPQPPRRGIELLELTLPTPA